MELARLADNCFGQWFMNVRGCVMTVPSTRSCIVIVALSTCAIFGATAPASAEPNALVSPNPYPASIFTPVLRDDPRDAAARQDRTLPARLQRQVINYPTAEAPGTVIIDTPNTHLHLV